MARPASVRLRTDRRFEASIALTALATTLLGFWSITRIRGEIVDYAVFWIPPLGALNLAILAGALARVLGAQWSRPESIDSRLGARGLGVLWALFFLASTRVGFRDLDRLVAFETSTRRQDADFLTTVESVREYVVSKEIRKPLFRIDGEWNRPAAVLMRLHHSGQSFAVEDKWLFRFTDAFSAHGDEDATITIGAGHDPQPEAPGDLVQREPVRVEAVRIHR